MKCTQLKSRALLRISGDDKADFLQGLISNDIHLLESQTAIYACLLTPQGKYLYDFFVIKAGDDFLIDCEHEKQAELLRKFTVHKLRSQVVITAEEGKVYTCWENPSGLPAGGFTDPRLHDLGYRFIANDDVGATASEKDFIDFCHERGVPYHSHDLIPQKSILLESNMDELNAISWDKGCYMGQELTARTKHRGLVRKRLFPVKISEDAVPFGADVVQDGKAVGEMRSSSHGIGLALVRLEAFESYAAGQASLTVGEASVKPYAPDWMDVCVPSSSKDTKSVKAPGNN